MCSNVHSSAVLQTHRLKRYCSHRVNRIKKQTKKLVTSESHKILAEINKSFFHSKGENPPLLIRMQKVPCGATYWSIAHRKRLVLGGLNNSAGHNLKKQLSALRGRFTLARQRERIQCNAPYLWKLPQHIWQSHQKLSFANTTFRADFMTVKELLFLHPRPKDIYIYSSLCKRTMTTNR